MATCSASELVAGHSCFCAATSNRVVLARLSLLCEILQNLDPMASCDLDDLMERGSCFCGVANSPAEIAELQLLCDIKGALSGGGVVGAPQILRGSGPPVSDPSDPTKGAIYYDDDPLRPSYETNWDWSVPGQFWIG